MGPTSPHKMPYYYVNKLGLFAIELIPIARTRAFSGQFSWSIAFCQGRCLRQTLEVLCLSRRLADPTRDSLCVQVEITVVDPSLHCLGNDSYVVACKLWVDGNKGNWPVSKCKEGEVWSILLMGCMPGGQEMPGFQNEVLTQLRDDITSFDRLLLTTSI